MSFKDIRIRAALGSSCMPVAPSFFTLSSTYLAIGHVHASSVLDLARVKGLANDAMPIPHVAHHFQDDVPVVDQDGVPLFGGAVEGLRKGGREGGGGECE